MSGQVCIYYILCLNLCKKKKKTTVDNFLNIQRGNHSNLWSLSTLFLMIFSLHIQFSHLGAMAPPTNLYILDKETGLFDLSFIPYPQHPHFSLYHRVRPQLHSGTQHHVQRCAASLGVQSASDAKISGTGHLLCEHHFGELQQLDPHQHHHHHQQVPGHTWLATQTHTTGYFLKSAL